MIVLQDNWHILPLPTCYLWCSSSTCDNERMCYELTYLYILPYLQIIDMKKRWIVKYFNQTNDHHIINEISNSQQLNKILRVLWYLLSGYCLIFGLILDLLILQIKSFALNVISFCFDQRNCWGYTVFKIKIESVSFKSNI